MQEVDANGKPKPTGVAAQLLSKANNDTTSIANPIAQQINLRTQAVDKLVKAIERNTGNDPTAH